MIAKIEIKFWESKIRSEEAKNDIPMYEELYEWLNTWNGTDELDNQLSG